MADSELKSSFELAMERLRRRDAEAGIEHRPLTNQQKAEIAEVRNFYEAKLAEMEVMHRSALSRTFDPAQREALEEDQRRERGRLIAERDAKIQRIRAVTRP